ncbi:type VI secretion system-associated FHA domain protein TagH [Mixta intestinalis]|uniref:Uncharacterized protein n=1 Tax=Mixta intestinalis TaxID=1615494 RepID=A0A6P1Q5F1_9GAMM|nr:type VI secretion system-associated FHA domain protein TagH [Mixta intestinalis]QHM73903.1 hypothetical protein C7M51_04264 [Mixta intestinalis]
MRFTIITIKPGHQPPQSSCDFSPPGGTIGRGVDNNLVLPDNDRTISRLQAIVHVSAAGECRITNRGNVTRVELNDIPLERGREVELQDGDILGIDEYRLLVSDPAAARQPTAQGAAPIARPVAQAAAPQARPIAQATEQAPRPAAQVADPLARPAAQTARPIAQATEPTVAPAAQIADPLAYLADEAIAPEPNPAPTASVMPQPEAAPAEPVGNTAAVPSEIWDSLAKEFSISDSISASPADGVAALDGAHPLTAPQAENRNPENPLAQFEAMESLSLDRRDKTPDSLFEKDELFQSDSIFNDSTPSTLMQSPAEKMPQPESKTEDSDPLALFGAGAAASSQLDSDDPLGLMMSGAVPLSHPDDEPSAASPEMNAAPSVIYMPPPEETPVAAPVTSAPETDLFSGLGDISGSPLFLDEPPPAAKDAGAMNKPQPDVSPYAPSVAAQTETDFEPSAPPAPEAPDYSGITLPTPQAVQRSAAPPPKGRLRIDPVSTSSKQPQPTSASGETLQGELLQALLDGMGLNDMQPTPHFDGENMQQLGQMLGMFSQGTVALLSSRSILKRGVKADMTVILDDANNPFKLLPSGKTVLMQMFGSRMPGFMPPKQAVRDALVDLQAHQLGMIAGIRAIIAAMLQSFNPQQLEEEARQEGVTSRLSLRGSRKAALWEYFTRRYNETAGEIEDDFHTLFGEAFLHAYDMEVNQYKDSQTSTDE